MDEYITMRDGTKVWFRSELTYSGIRVYPRMRLPELLKQKFESELRASRDVVSITYPTVFKKYHNAKHLKTT